MDTTPVSLRLTCSLSGRFILICWCANNYFFFTIFKLKGFDWVSEIWSTRALKGSFLLEALVSLSKSPTGKFSVLSKFILENFKICTTLLFSMVDRGIIFQYWPVTVQRSLTCFKYGNRVSKLNPFAPPPNKPIKIVNFIFFLIHFSFNFSRI